MVADPPPCHLDPAADPVRQLVITDPALFAQFEGSISQVDGRAVLTGPRSAHNAAALRALIPWLRPKLLGLATSAGMGDRLGLATPGHIAAVRATGSVIAPILAQQSIREMTRANRSAQQVLDDAMWGVLATEWRLGYGADADHLKTFEDIDRCVAAGFTFYTFDPSPVVDSAADSDDAATLARKVAALDWAGLECGEADFRRRFTGLRTDLESQQVTINEDAAMRAAAKYGAAVLQVARMHRHLAASGAPFEIEISVDETDAPTTHAEHIYVARELARLGVPWVSLAPRYIGDFEKGVDYIGDLDAFARSLGLHAEIARAFGGYKLSLHSGSDKFAIYSIAAALTRGRVHLKTAGTSWLEALRVLALREPMLFRGILTLARARYADDRASYHVSGEISRVPEAAQLRDVDLPALLEDRDARQVLHVTFGSTMQAFRAEIYSALNRHAADYDAVLERHFVRHLAPFASHAAT